MNANSIGYIYKITAPDGRICIGQTINVKQRKYFYNSFNFKCQTKLYNHCIKHSWNPLDSFEIIDECVCGDKKSELNLREIYWITFYDSFKNGLNCTTGGGGNTGRTWSDEQKINHSKTMSGRKQTTEHIKNRVNSRDGYKHTPETIAQIKKSNEGVNKGRKLTQKTKNKLQKYQKTHTNSGRFKPKYTFSDIKQCNKKTGKIIKIWSDFTEIRTIFKSYDTITLCLLGKRKSAHGFTWSI